jgi:hypothetical protein
MGIIEQDIPFSQKIQEEEMNQLGTEAFWEKLKEDSPPMLNYSVHWIFNKKICEDENKIILKPKRSFLRQISELSPRQ